MERTEGRIPPESLRNREEYLLYLRRLFAYDVARDTLPAHASVLEIGCPAEFLTRYSLSDFYIIKSNLTESLDLLGICTK